MGDICLPGSAIGTASFRRFRRWGDSAPVHGGRSRGGLTRKIVALVDALGNRVRFLLLPEQSHESKGQHHGFSNLPLGVLLAGKAFDNHMHNRQQLCGSLEFRGNPSCRTVTHFLSTGPGSCGQKGFEMWV